MKSMNLSVSAQKAKEILLSNIRTDRSLIRLAYTMRTIQKGVFGKLNGDRFWLMDFYDEDDAAHLRIYPKRFYFGSIAEREGKAVISGKFKFPWAYSIYYSIFFLFLFLSPLTEGWYEVVTALIVSAVLTIIFALLSLLYAYVDSRKSEKKMLRFLEEIYGEFVVTEM